MKKQIILEKELERLPNAGIPITYVINIMLKNKVAVDINIDTINLVLNNSEPMTTPRGPVATRIITASCGLIAKRINADEKSTIIPIGISIVAANIIGKVLKELKMNPTAGKNTGADWNSTAIDVNIPPIQIVYDDFNFLSINNTSLGINEIISTLTGGATLAEIMQI